MAERKFSADQASVQAEEPAKEEAQETRTLGGEAARAAGASAQALGETLSLLAAADVGDSWTPSQTIRAEFLQESERSLRSEISQLPMLRTDERQGEELHVRGELGRGGMGVVRRAYQRSLRREVAVKALHKDVAFAPDAIKQLLREAYITGKLEHPNIIPLHALGYNEEDGPLLLMKRVSGVSWKAVLEADLQKSQHDDVSTRREESLEATASKVLEEGAEAPRQEATPEAKASKDHEGGNAAKVSPSGDSTHDERSCSEADAQEPPEEGATQATGELLAEQVDAGVVAGVLSDGGEALRTRAQGPLDRLVRHVEILMQLCNAVHFSHSKGVLHLDLKPSNVMIGDFGEVYLVDWGVAQDKVDLGRLERNVIVGTPAYMAPELTQGVRYADERTDVYLLGATLHNILTGKARHLGQTLSDVFAAAIESSPYQYNASIPRELGEICNKACAQHPTERYPSALALRQALAGFLRHRASIELTQASAQQYEQLRATLAQETSAQGEDEAQRERVHELAASCRFGLQQALREWPENTEAKELLQDCLETLFAHALTQRYVGTAFVLLSEMPQERPGLRDQLALLRQELREEEEAKAELARLERETRLHSDTWGRSILIFLIGLVWSGLSFWFARAVETGAIKITMHFNILFGFITLGVVLSTLLIFRRALLVNQMHRRFAFSLVVLVCAMIFSRLFARSFGLTFPQSVAFDLLLFACHFGFTYPFITQARFSFVVLFFGAASIAAFKPDYSLYLMGCCLLSANTLIAWGSRPLPATTPEKRR